MSEREAYKTRHKVALTALPLAALIAFLVAIPSHAASPKTPSARGNTRASPARPNILIFVADDQAWPLFTRQLMPNVFGQIVDEGVTFNRFYVDDSLCCPSRSQIMTGLSEHHTGVDSNWTNSPLKRPTIVQALHDQGYRTAITGKYLNSEPCDPRPEFDVWVCSSRPPSNYSLKDPTLNVNGTWQTFTGYTTDILANYLDDFISSTPADVPFFAMYTPTSPHLPANDDRYYNVPVPPARTTSYNEDTTSHMKPQYMRKPPLTTAQAATIDLWHQHMTEAVIGLDASIGSILATLGSRADNTLIFYVSDNGFLYGEHRRWAKIVPYEESVRVPFAVRYPPDIPRDSPFVSDALTQNIDIAPTIADAVGFQWVADGKSLVPLMTGATSHIHDAALTEHCEGVTFPCPGDDWSFKYDWVQTVPSFEAVITTQYKYIEYVTGERELYDLEADPAELTNLAGNPDYGTLQSSLAGELQALLAAPPVDTAIVTGPSGLLHTRTPAFTYYSQSRFAHYLCRIDLNGGTGSWSACGYQSTVEGPLVDGDYVFEVAGVDERGSVDSTPAARAFSIHSVGPTVTIVAAPPVHLRGTSAAFSYSSETRGAEFQCALSELGMPDTWQSCPSTGQSYSSLADGVWHFRVKAIDPSFGTESDPPAEWLFQVDNKGPTMTYDTHPPAATQATYADFTFHANETTTGKLTCSLDKGAAHDCSDGSYSVSGVAPGNHTLSVVGTDEVGNTGGTPFAWKVDQIAPVATITGAPAPYVKLPSASFSLAANEPGGTFRCQVDGGYLWRCLSSNWFPGLIDGTHFFTAFAVDAAGNVSAPVSYSWVQDRVAPTITSLTGPASGTNSRTAAFQFTSSEQGVTFTCTLDGVAAACVSGVTYSDLMVGTHRFSVKATDLAGNVGPAKPWSWTIKP